jgi:acetyltransferase-like isoleucine patch superfamily enzyme
MLIQKDRFPVKDIVLFGFLPSFLKKIIYRLRGYHIGKKVSLGLGAVICGQEVSIGDHTSIGFFTIIRGKKIKIGSFVSIGSATMLDTPHLEIGDGTKINEQVFVGGLQFPDSKLIIGRNCQIMQMSFINPATSITIGDDTGIGGDCLLFGHTSWLSAFEGYPVKFEPIEIGNSVSISWRVFVLPGTKIGDGAVIGANSLVHKTIPPKCLAVGFPARVVSSYPEFPKQVLDNEKPGILKPIVKEMTEYFTNSGLLCRNTDEDIYEITLERKKLLGIRKAKHYRMYVAYGDIEKDKIAKSGRVSDVLLSLNPIPVEVRDVCQANKVMWIDIANKQQSYFWNDLGEEVALYLKRYGVRLYRSDAR